jgi:hypothetical protein
MTFWGEVDTVAPANCTVILELAAKPCPDIVIEVLLRPLIGIILMEGITVKVAEAELTPSLAKTGLTPAVSEALKVAEKLPVAFAVTVEGFVVVGFPSKLMVMVELEIKFDPVTVTDVPTGPLAGLTVMLEVVTVKVAEAVLKLVSTMVTVLLPAVEPVGTVNVTPGGILPDPSVVVGPLRVTRKPLKVTKSGELAAKPLPETVTA